MNIASRFRPTCESDIQRGPITHENQARFAVCIEIAARPVSNEASKKVSGHSTPTVRWDLAPRTSILKMQDVPKKVSELNASVRAMISFGITQ